MSLAPAAAAVFAASPVLAEAGVGPASPGPAWLPVLISLLLLAVPLLAVFGNGLVMIAVFQERSLQTVTNLLIVSLAVSDLLVAVFVMSFAVYFQMNSFEWGLGPVMCNVYLASDVACSTASILNLLAISLDRYMAISHPLAYAQHGARFGRAAAMISVVWGVSIAVALPILFGVNPPDDELQCHFANPYFNILSSLFSFFLPCGAMMALYTVIFKRLRARERARTQRKAKRAEHDRISTALLGGARIASQMGRHFKNRTDQILLEISFQTSSYPTLSDSSDGVSSCSTYPNGVLTQSGHPPTEATPSAPLSPPIQEDGKQIAEESPDDGVSTRQHSPHETEEQPPAQPESPEREDSDTTARSFGGHLQELLPFIDSGMASRRSSAGGEEVQRSDSSRRHRKPHRTHDLVVARLERRASKRNGVLPTAAECTPPPSPAALVDPTAVAPRHQEADDSLPPLTSSITVSTSGATGFSRPVLHQIRTGPSANGIIPGVTVERASVAGGGACVPLLLQHQQATPPAYRAIGGSVRLYRKELWKRVTSGWKARPSRHLVKKATKQMKREHKATVTLAVVLAVFLAFWLPFFTLHFTNSVCVLVSTDTCIPDVMLFLTTWLGYMNSSVNPLIYTVFDQRFRHAFHNIVFCRSRRR